MRDYDEDNDGRYPDETAVEVGFLGSNLGNGVTASSGRSYRLTRN